MIVPMEHQPSSEIDTQTRTRLTLARGNFYFSLGFALLAGLVAVVGLGLFGMPVLGIFSVNTAFAMAGIAIALIAAVAFVTLVTLRRTLDLLSHHDMALADQAARHADLAAQVQSQWRAEQVVRDRDQDEAMETLSARQDADFVAGRSEPNGAPKAAVETDLFEGGQIHPVIDVEGIGEHYSKLLVDLGVKDTKQLWNADKAYLARALDATPEAIHDWQCMAELMAVTDIGQQYAELLVRADVASIDQLCNETGQPLLARIQRLEKRQGIRIQGNTIGIKAVQSWIHAAQAHRAMAAAVAPGA